MLTVTPRVARYASILHYDHLQCERFSELKPNINLRSLTDDSLRGDTVVEAKATLKVDRTSGKYVLIYSKQSFVPYHGHMLQTVFLKGQYFVATHQKRLSPLPTTVSILKGKSGLSQTFSALIWCDAWCNG